MDRGPAPDGPARGYARYVGRGEGIGPRGSQAERLYIVAEALTGALTPEDVAAAVFERALADLGASTAGFWLLDGDEIRFAGGAGHLDDSPYRVGAIPTGSDLPAAVAARTKKSVAYGSHAEREAKWPGLTGLGGGAEAVAVVPLLVGDRVLGCVHIGYRAQMAVEQMEIPLLEQLAGLCAIALNRSFIFEEEREVREQLAFFSDATHALIRSLDPDQVLEGLVETAVPRLAPWCAVLSPEGSQLHTVAVRIAGDGGSAARVVEREVFPIAGDYAVSRCFRTGRIQVTEQVQDYITTAQVVGQETAEAIRNAGLAATVAVAIPWAGQPIGVLVLGYTDVSRVRSVRLLETAEGLALRAGAALHNASRFDAERTVARTLTEALLPPSVPQVPGYEVAARYLPASGNVAGDWYDLFPAGGKFVLGVGDSAGHGIPAATVMAELRNAARGLAAAGLSPAEILDNLNLVADFDQQDMFATAVYGVLDVSRHVLDWALAGHPPPILLRAGAAVLLGEEHPGTVFGTPIASGIRGERSEQEIQLEVGDLLVFYTDGVIERRFATLEEGTGRLIRMAEQMTGASPSSLAARIIEELCEDAADDCCVLVLRREFLS